MRRRQPSRVFQKDDPGTAISLDLIESVDKSGLVNGKGVTYRDFKRSLRPRYGVVWLHLASGYAALAATTLAIGVTSTVSAAAGLIAAILGGVIYGYFLAYLQLFFHEAAHYNIAPSRAWNDRLANLFLGSLVGQDIATYRPVHFDHHRHLGTPMDSDHSYFDPLNVRFVVESLLLIKVVKVLSGRKARGAGKPDAPRSPARVRQLAMGLVLHAVFVGGSVGLGAWPVGLGWCLGVAVFFPFIFALRQVLEHRDEAARGDIDYHAVPHGAVSRLFGSGPLDATLGAAGFNRHLLHHWEPQVSCTRLAELEAFLMDSELGPVLRPRKTTYFTAFRRLFRADRGSAR
jgi:fatty acid desaturase